MRSFLKKAAVLSLSLLGMSATAASCVAADIAKAYPSAGAGGAAAVVTLPSVVAVFFSLACGWLSVRFGKRKLLFAGLALYVAGGVAPVFLNGSFALVLVLRGVLGAGIGLIMPFSTSLIANMFAGEERAAMMGRQSMCVNIGSMAAGFAAGLLGAADWRNAFLVYLAGIAVLLFVFFFLPEPDNVPAADKGGAKLPPAVYLLAFLAFLFFLAIFPFFTKLPIVLAEEKLGDSASAGLAVTLFYGGGVVSGFVYWRIARFLKSFTAFAVAGICGIGFLLLYFARGLPAVLASAAVIGFGFAMMMPCILLKASEASPKLSSTLANAVILSAVNVGSFASPYVFQAFGSMMGNSSERVAFLISSVCLMAFSLAAPLMRLRKAPERPRDYMAN